MKRGSIFGAGWRSASAGSSSSCSSACCGNDRWLRDTCHYCCRRCGKRWIKTRGSGYSDSGISGDVCHCHTASAVSYRKKNRFCHWFRSSYDHGSQLCLCTQYAGNCGRLWSCGYFWSQIVGGIVALVMGLLVRQIRVFFPPLITGTVVFTIGLSLYPTAINYMAGGVGSENYGDWQNWLVAFFTLAVVTALNHFGKGICKLASILIGIIAGYIVSIPFGMVDLTSVGEAGAFQGFRQFMHFGVEFEISSCVAISILFAINSVQAIGDYSATTIGSMNRTPKDRELQNGIVAYGLTIF